MPCHALLVGHTIPLCVVCVGFALQCRFCWAIFLENSGDVTRMIQDERMSVTQIYRPPQPLLSFPAHGPKRAYVALCALYPVCAELFLPYESSADRRPAKPKPLAYYVESLQGQRNRQEYPIFCFTPSSRSTSAPPAKRPLKRHFTTKQ